MTVVERTYPLTSPPYVFVGKKAVAVLFGSERIEVKTWREVYGTILARCNQDPRHHVMLMCLRNKVAGKVRLFLSDSPDSMTRPLKIDEELYAESHYGSQTLMHILVIRILNPAGFDSSGVSIVVQS